MMKAIWKVIFDLTDPKSAIGAAFFGVIALVLAWLIARAVKLAIHRYLDRVEKAGAKVQYIARPGAPNETVYTICYIENGTPL